MVSGRTGRSSFKDAASEHIHCEFLIIVAVPRSFSDLSIDDKRTTKISHRPLTSAYYATCLGCIIMVVYEIKFLVTESHVHHASVQIDESKVRY